MTGGKRKYGDESSGAVYSSKSRSRQTVEARVDPTYGQRSAIPGLDDDTMMDGDDYDLDYDEEMNALEYLRAVRQEAIGIPNLLVAPQTPPSSNNRDIYDDGDGDFRGWYADGAYVASSRHIPENGYHDGEDGKTDPQSPYFDSILSRYNTLRAQLVETPPRVAMERLGRSHPTHVGRLNKDLTRSWIRNMKTTHPKPAQIASMDKASVLRLLRLLTQGTLLKRGLGVEMGISQWTWSLLAKLPDRGELSSEEIGVVRDLGKKAVLVGMAMREDKEWEEGIAEVEANNFDGDLDEEEETSDVVNDEEILLEDENDADSKDPGGFENSATTDLDSDEDAFASATVTSSQKEVPLNGDPRQEDEEGSTHHKIQKMDPSSEEMSDEPEALTAAKARILDRIMDEEPHFEVNVEPEISTTNESAIDPDMAKLNTKATVDMIITVAGEIYGQRDLLEFRGQWGDM